MLITSINKVERKTIIRLTAKDIIALLKRNTWYVEVTTTNDYVKKPNHTFYGKTFRLLRYLKRTELEVIKEIKIYREPKENIDYYDIDND